MLPIPSVRQFEKRSPRGRLEEAVIRGTVQRRKNGKAHENLHAGQRETLRGRQAQLAPLPDRREHTPYLHSLP